ncbi:hypothetical protein [Mycobacterium sp.]|nr:hypothetical protein [Mycobacterium sp.]
MIRTSGWVWLGWWAAVGTAAAVVSRRAARGRGGVVVRVESVG